MYLNIEDYFKRVAFFTVYIIMNCHISYYEKLFRLTNGSYMIFLLDFLDEKELTKTFIEYPFLFD